MSSEIGNADSQALGVSDDLRRDPKAWNDLYDATAASDDQLDAQVVAVHRANAFDLAARVQPELGDDMHLWCAAGEGVDMLPSPMQGTTVVVSAAAPGTTIEQWSTHGAESRQIALSPI